VQYRQQRLALCLVARVLNDSLEVVEDEHDRISYRALKPSHEISADDADRVTEANELACHR